jgi:RimJ/RimL family protein N-acetyltransferase
MLKITVRGATPEDIDWLLSQLREFSNFFGTRRSLFGDDDYSQSAMLNMIQNHIVFIAEREDVGPIGFISGYIIPHPYNPEIRLLSETFWWVDEEYRGTRAGLMLLNQFTDWGKKNADWITFALEEKSPVKETCLTKRGFRLHERSFLLEVS